MGKNSEIAWTDHTWNPWQGCHKVSPGCAHCYMFRDKKRFGQDPGKVVRSKDATFNKPLSWKEPAKVFVCSWSDFFIEDADAWRDDAWSVMINSPHLTFLLLTKRPENIVGNFPTGGWPENVWLGITAENQEQYDKRVRILNLFLNAPVLFVSVEPMLGPIHLHSLSTKTWIICGGESGPDARPMQEDWAYSLKKRCEDTGTPFFMKQMSGKSKTAREAIPDNLMLRGFPEE